MRGGVRGGAAALLCNGDALGAEARDSVRGAPLRGAHLLTHSHTGQ